MAKRKAFTVLYTEEDGQVYIDSVMGQERRDFLDAMKWVKKKLDHSSNSIMEI
jgi:hypothetical protein